MIAAMGPRDGGEGLESEGLFAQDTTLRDPAPVEIGYLMPAHTDARVGR